MKNEKNHPEKRWMVVILALLFCTGFAAETHLPHTALAEWETQFDENGIDERDLAESETDSSKETNAEVASDSGANTDAGKENGIDERDLAESETNRGANTDAGNENGIGACDVAEGETGGSKATNAEAASVSGEKADAEVATDRGKTVDAEVETDSGKKADAEVETDNGKTTNAESVTDSSEKAAAEGATDNGETADAEAVTDSSEKSDVEAETDYGEDAETEEEPENGEPENGEFENMEAQTDSDETEHFLSAARRSAARQSYVSLTGMGTLTASEDTGEMSADLSKTYIFDFAGEEDQREALIGEMLYVRSVDIDAQDGLKLDSVTNIDENRTIAGSDYANQTFALTMQLKHSNETLSEAAEEDVQIDISSISSSGLGRAIGEITEDSRLIFELHNANAITKGTTAGTITLVLSTDSDDSLDASETNLITIRLTIQRKVSQIHVSVPLVLMLRTNIDGGTINVDMSDYQIKNDSSMRVQLTALEIREKENADACLQKKDTKVTTGDRDTCHISLKRDWKNHNLYAADSSKADGYNPIDQIEISPLSFLTTPDERKGVYLTSFYYTISIPKTND